MLTISGLVISRHWADCSPETPAFGDPHTRLVRKEKTLHWHLQASMAGGVKNSHFLNSVALYNLRKGLIGTSSLSEISLSMG